MIIEVCDYIILSSEVIWFLFLDGRYKTDTRSDIWNEKKKKPLSDMSIENRIFFFNRFYHNPYMGMGFLQNYRVKCRFWKKTFAWTITRSTV